MAWQLIDERVSGEGTPVEPDWFELLPDPLPPELSNSLGRRPFAQLLVLFDKVVARMRQTHVAS